MISAIFLASIATWCECQYTWQGEHLFSFTYWMSIWCSLLRKWWPESYAFSIILEFWSFLFNNKEFHYLGTLIIWLSLMWNTSNLSKCNDWCVELHMFFHYFFKLEMSFSFFKILEGKPLVELISCNKQACLLNLLHAFLVVVILTWFYPFPGWYHIYRA